MFTSAFVVLADTFTRIAAPEAPTIVPGTNVSDTVNAAANRFDQSTVLAGDSIVTTAAASPDA